MRLLLPVVAALAISANAQENERLSYMRMSPVLNALDSNRDGVISADEIRHSPEALRTLDKNGDGTLTRDEYSPNFGGRGPGREGGRGEGRGEGPPPDPSNELVQTLMGFDKNHDGKISKDELPERMQGMFDRGDTNKDGFLSPDEIRRMAAAQARQQITGAKVKAGAGAEAKAAEAGVVGVSIP
jgi:Ca2+-binding EF-hand superfamily protein